MMYRVGHVLCLYIVLECAILQAAKYNPRACTAAHTAVRCN